MGMPILVGTAGWSIPASARERFSESGSSLERYASRFPAAEINSCFHRPHRRSTYERWAASVPIDFRFSAKLPKTISHGGKLGDSGDLIQQFADEVAGLGPKLGIVLVQFPPSLAFDIAPVSAMFDALRSCLEADIACEPRHQSWFNERVDAFLATKRIARVATDPVRGVNGERPGGWRDLAYYRLHGSPRVYYSSYDKARLSEIHMGLLQDAAIASSAWCVFDNTASSAATANALDLFEMFRNSTSVSL
jgi:uncharacterized protein YecE (DUF72 family)